jgi:hypothetical protein
MFGTLLSPLVRWIGGILLVLSVVFGIYYKGRLDERKLFNAYKTEVKAAAMAQEEKTRRIEEKNAKLFKETRDAYNTKLTGLRTYYGLRINGQGGSGLSKAPNATGGVNDYSPDNLPPTPVLAGQCAETTLNLLALQDWVRSAANNAE